jgi:hypothetical protein
VSKAKQHWARDSIFTVLYEAASCPAAGSPIPFLETASLFTFSPRTILTNASFRRIFAELSG